MDRLPINGMISSEMHMLKIKTIAVHRVLKYIQEFRLAKKVQQFRWVPITKPNCS